MSLILEALKKSEAKRRLGETPDLATPFSAPKRPSMVLPVVVVLIAVVLVWWAFFSTPAAPPVAPRQAESSPRPKGPVHAAPQVGQNSGAPLRAVTGDNSMQSVPPPANIAKAPPEPRPSGEREPNFVAVGPPPNASPGFGANRAQRDAMAARRRAASVNSAMKPSSRPSDAATSPGQIAAAPPAPAASANTAKPAVAAPNPIAPAAPAAIVANPAVPAQTKPVAATPAPSAAATDAPSARAPKTPGTIGLPAPADSTPKPAAPSTSAQPYSELPFSIRKALPELHLSMHAYLSDPAKRFVVLNDTRLTEGEKTSDDVFVREIRPDGVVLEFQNQRFFYPRDGL